MKGKIKQPRHSGVVRVPQVIQMEDLECGAAALTMVLAYYNKWIPLEQVRRDCGISRDGSNADNVMRAAQGYGLTVELSHPDAEEIIHHGQFPCIIQWNDTHYLVLDGFRHGKAYVSDPAFGAYTVELENFGFCYTGTCLNFCPGESFEPSGKPKSIWRFARRKLAGCGAAFALVVISTVISSLTGLITPGMTKVFSDRLLTGQNPEWFGPFMAIMAALAAVELTVTWIESVYSLKANGKIAVVGNSEYMWHVLRLPMEFFSQRMAGDICGRRQQNAMIASTLINSFAPLVLQSIMMIFYLVVMVRYSWQLSLIGIASIVVNFFVSAYIAKKRTNIMLITNRDSGKLSGSTIAGIEMVESIKASGAENGYFEKWSGYQASVNAGTVEFTKLNTYVGMIPSIVSTVTDTLIFMGSVWLCMRGEWTVGMIAAFSGFLNAFTTPALMLVDVSQMVQEMRSDMERIEDVMDYPTDVPETSALPDENTEYDKLSGKIELRHVTFGYSPLAAPLIEDFSMTLEPGQRVAFVGSSGCGKSTLAKLISGLYKPWSGEILFDGKPIDEIDRSVFTGSLSVVDQDITIFEDTIADNIKMWDNSIEDFEMILAARDAQIHEDIMQRDGGYRYKLAEGGKDLSGGQRQRLEIARVLSQDPTAIILDEATSALDAKTEYDVVRSISERGITCIVIAHRLSTIRDCDEIIVLDHGHVVERGTHDELYARGGAYAQLVTSD